MEFGELLGLDLAAVLAATLCIPGLSMIAWGIVIVVVRPAGGPISRARTTAATALIAIGGLLTLGGAGIIAYTIGLFLLFYVAGRA